MGIKVNSIEQPLNLDQPDNKIMLAIYLAVPEVENDKISIRTTEGSRRANKEGCWTSTAPIGYKNQRTSEGKASLVKSEKSELVKEAFEYITKGFPADEVRRIMHKKGLNISKSRFHLLIKNPVYNGKVKVPAYKNEDEYYAEGLHDAIVSDQLFNRVQDILKGRKRSKKKWSTKNENLPLRGHILCSKCGRILTGSASTGRWGGKYYYYHCRLGCKERFKVDQAHDMLDDFLSKCTIDKGISDLYYDIVSERYGNNKQVRSTKMNRINKEIKELKEIISRAEDNLFEGKIGIATFEKGKVKYLKKITDLEFDHSELKNHGLNFMTQIKTALKIFENLKNLYNNASWEGKQMLMGSIFTEKIIFEKNRCRTLLNMF
ncbi:recombinase family protein [Aquimarina megaterium]|uniref:recombinase family protein n=1 Tax=Aquimarina megaterium TaxID=1443666 RepID=UPI0004715E0F|nr:recombinase family protein [Aquimarina megaterium]